jgi:RNA polymerase sigma-70 factor, ECF subfamily
MTSRLRASADRDRPEPRTVDTRSRLFHPESVSSTARADSIAEVAPAVPAEDQGKVSELNDLARDALRKDPASVRRFLGAITPLVCTICRGVMGRHNPDLEDAIQDCLVVVVSALPQFRFESDVRHYITKITLRRAIVVRQRARQRATRLVAMEAQDLHHASLDDATEVRAELVRNLLEDLRKEQADVLRLRLMLGHSISEIADITGVSQNTVKTRLRLGKTQLRHWLERRGEGPRERR